MVKKFDKCLRCAHCGSTTLSIVQENVFSCDYCGEKLNLDLDNVEFTSENEIIYEELKEKFYKKFYAIDKDRSVYKRLLVRYSNKADSKKFFWISIVCFVVSCLLLYSSVSVEEASCLLNIFIIAVALSGGSCVVGWVFCKIRYKKYKPIALYYAAKVADCEEEMSVYTKLISKITKSK